MNPATSTTKTTKMIADLLAMIEQPEPIFAATDVCRWPASTLEALQQTGLLTEATPAEVAACPACIPDHIELVRWIREPGLSPRACIACSREGLHWLKVADLQRWHVRLPTFASTIATALRASGQVEERVPNRVWKLGTVRLGRAWLATWVVGLDRGDAVAVLDAVPELSAPNALLIVNHRWPDSALWRNRPTPAIVNLADVLTWNESHFHIDHQLVADSLPSALRTVPKLAVRQFPTPTGTVWEDVTLAVGELSLLVQVGNVAEQFGFAEAGFENRREKNRPDESWELLRLLAQLRGELGTSDAITTKPAVLKQRVSVLRHHLRDLLGLEDDPFHPTPKNQPYRARFTIRTSGPVTFPTPPHANWDDLTITESRDDWFVISVGVEERGSTRIFSANTDASRHEATTTAQTRSARYRLTDFGFTKEAATAFRAVLRGGGQIGRSANDAGLLALGRSLTEFFQISAPPFEFDSNRKLWIARFEAVSEVDPREAR